MTPFQSLRDYEIFVYTLPQQFPSIERSTLTVARRGRLYAELSGELTFAGGLRLSIYERLSWDTGPLLIEGYSYEAWRGSDKLYWYDSQPHPHDPTLASTDPHHKHVPPDIKHNRIPAPSLTFSAPNLPFLIREAELLPDD
ncbi:MAG: hypothetical protein KF893_09855 [Caldilineaceae bacterium]|nr:hypothetical protein [Caldilineaceae bacterium]